MVLELLADAPDIASGHVQALPTDGTISVLNVPHCSIVFDLYQVTEIRAELLGDAGVATEAVKHANIVKAICSDDELAALDVELDASYRRSIQLLSAPRVGLQYHGSRVMAFGSAGTVSSRR